ncbi:MAG: helix-turn-helix domain-containing protein [Alphaproteobacteria bacterium]
MKVNHLHKTPDDLRVKIVAAVWRKGMSCKSLSLSRGLGSSACGGAFNQSGCVSGEIALCEFIEISPLVLWPERWENPTPKRGAWLQANREKLAEWTGNRLEDVGR